MTGSMENLVHDGLDRLTAEVRAPAGVLARAVRRQRRRRAMTRAGIASTTAAATAAAVITVSGGGGTGTGPGIATSGGHGLETTAYVTQRVSRALSPAMTSARVQGLSIRWRPLWYHGQPVTVPTATTTWSYQGQPRLLDFYAPDGRLTAERWLPSGVYAQLASRTWAYTNTSAASEIPPPMGLFVFTLNTSAARARASLPPPVATIVPATRVPSARVPSARRATPGRAARAVPPRATNPASKHAVPHLVTPSNGCRVSRAGDVHTFVATPSFIRGTLECGGLAVTGHARVNGQDVIKLTGTKRLESGPLTLYVSPVSYLPVQADTAMTVEDFQWQAPTQANLAKLKVRIPEGFRQVRTPHNADIWLGPVTTYELAGAGPMQAGLTTSPPAKRASG